MTVIFLFSQTGKNRKHLRTSNIVRTVIVTETFCFTSTCRHSHMHTSGEDVTLFLTVGDSKKNSNLLFSTYPWLLTSKPLLLLIPQVGNALFPVISAIGDPIHPFKDKPKCHFHATKCSRRFSPSQMSLLPFNIWYFLMIHLWP